MIKDSDIRQKTLASLHNQEKKPDINQSTDESVDERIMELIEYLFDAKLPFPATDVFEYWLLDGKD